MWFGSPDRNSVLNSQSTRVEIPQPSNNANPSEIIPQILNSTTCFDLMRNSSKVCFLFLLTSLIVVDCAF